MVGQVAPDALSLKVELAHRQEDDEGSHAQYDAKICRKAEQPIPEVWQIKWQQQARETKIGGDEGAETLAILSIIAQQLFVSRLPGWICSHFVVCRKLYYLSAFFSMLGAEFFA